MTIIDKLFSLSGKTALITGSSRGLGLGFATVLGQAGAKVVLNGVNTETLDASVRRLRSSGLDAHGSAFSVTSRAEVTAAVERMEAEVGPIDILVNNAGIQRRHPAEEFPEAEFDDVIAINLKGAFIVAQAVVRGMIARKSGKIINICSLQSELGRQNITPYAASKGGLKMMTRGMAVEWARHNIQANGIGPGYFSTEMTKALVDDEKFSAWLCGRTPADRWGKPEELYGTLLLLASEASSFINGQIIYVDGGVLSSM